MEMKTCFNCNLVRTWLGEGTSSIRGERHERVSDSMAQMQVRSELFFLFEQRRV